MSKRITAPKATKARVYSGMWLDGTIGWETGPHIHPDGDPSMSDFDRNPYIGGERFFLCEVTLKPILNKSGRPITRIVPKSRGDK